MCVVFVKVFLVFGDPRYRVQWCVGPKSRLGVKTRTKRVCLFLCYVVFWRV